MHKPRRAHLFGDLLPLQLAHLGRVGVEGHLLPVQVGLRRLVLGQVLRWQCQLHGLQQLEHVLLHPHYSTTFNYTFESKLF